jgi:GDP-mannose transporter
MAPVTLLFCLMLWTSGKALRFVSMPTFTVFKNLAVVGTTGWEYVRFGSRVSMGIIFSLALMVSGSIVAGAGDLTASREGFFWMLVNVLCTVAYVASLKELVPPELPSSAKTYANNLLSFGLFLGVALSNGEFSGFFAAIGQQTTAFKVALLFTGVIGTAINMSTFWCARVTSGATYAFVGASTKIPVAVIGHFAFHSALTVGGWMGVLLGLGSGITFAITKERERRHAIAAKADAERGELIEDSRSEDGLESTIPDRASPDDDDDDLESSKPKELRF